MPDRKTLESIEWLERYSKEHGLPGKAASVIEDLEQAIKDYLQWLPSKGYAPGTQNCYRQNLNQFLKFVKCRRFSWAEVFTLETLNSFMTVKGHNRGYGVRGLSKYLSEKGIIEKPIQENDRYRLPDIYEEYLEYYFKIRLVHRRTITSVRRILKSFHRYIKETELSKITIEMVDIFLTRLTHGLEPASGKAYRSALKGFLRYLYHERKILKRDLAPLIIGPPEFAHNKPPEFLRPGELQRLFDSMDVSTASGLRSYAILMFAYTLGLRPKETSLISLDDISFKQCAISIKDRKNNKPVVLPVPEDTVKAIAAYIIGGRPETGHRRLFVTINAPHRPVTPQAVSRCIKTCMQQAGLDSKPYHLRHTYAQNLLEQGASIFEIKEMLGHDELQSSMVYLNIHTKLMREVLFEETV